LKHVSQRARPHDNPVHAISGALNLLDRLQPVGMNENPSLESACAQAPGQSDGIHLRQGMLGDDDVRALRFESPQGGVTVSDRIALESLCA
jgi:hypothetical protein